MVKSLGPTTTSKLNFYYIIYDMIYTSGGNSCLWVGLPKFFLDGGKALEIVIIVV